jgi:site-specific DNA-methyltransferase (adenine-specific)
MNQLYHGDCLDIMPQLESNSIDMILCDLPYGTTACKWDSVIDLTKLWDEYKRLIKDNGVICLFGQEPFSSVLRTSNLEMYRYDWIWQKQKPSNFQLMGYQCGRVHEEIMVFSKAKACYTKNGVRIMYNPQTEKRERVRKANAKIYSGAELLHNYSKKQVDNFKEYEDKQPISILKFNTVEHRVHPTQKPVDLLEYLIKTYTDVGMTVLDNCMGSGSTGIACKNLDRNFIGIEKEEKYFNIAKEAIDV